MHSRWRPVNIRVSIGCGIISWTWLSTWPRKPASLLSKSTATKLGISANVGRGTCRYVVGGSKRIYNLLFTKKCPLNTSTVNIHETRAPLCAVYCTSYKFAHERMSAVFIVRSFILSKQLVCPTSGFILSFQCFRSCMCAIRNTWHGLRTSSVLPGCVEQRVGHWRTWRLAGQHQRWALGASLAWQLVWRSRSTQFSAFPFVYFRLFILEWCRFLSGRIS